MPTAGDTDADILLWRDYGRVKATSDPWLRRETELPFFLLVEPSGCSSPELVFLYFFLFFTLSTLYDGIPESRVFRE